MVGVWEVEMSGRPTDGVKEGIILGRSSIWMVELMPSRRCWYVGILKVASIGGGGESSVNWLADGIICPEAVKEVALCKFTANSISAWVPKQETRE